MSKLPFSSVELELDLAFNSPSKDLLEQFLEKTTRLVLIDAEIWEKDLRDWIQFVRTDQSLPCPEVVRQTPTLSMGLQLIV